MPIPRKSPVTPTRPSVCVGPGNDPDWNPGGAQQIIAFRVPGHPTFMIISFEDIPATAAWQDRDFEDVIIVVDHGYDFEAPTIPH